MDKIYSLVAKHIDEFNSLTQEEKDSFWIEIAQPEEKKNKSKNFQNQMADTSIIQTIEQKAKKDKLNTYYYNKTIISDDKISQSYKSLGIHIKQKVVYGFVSIEEDGGIIIKNDKGKKVKNFGNLKGEQTKDSVTIYNYAYVLNNKDAQILQHYLDLRNSKESILDNNISPKRADSFDSLSYVINATQNEEDTYLTLVHELKHIKNNKYMSYINSSDKFSKITAQTNYASMEDDEKSATLEAVFKAIELYFKNDNQQKYLSPFGDLSIKVSNIAIEGYQNKKTKQEVEQDKKDYLTDLTKLVPYCINNWEKNHKEVYERQFAHNMSVDAKNLPVKYVSLQNQNEDKISKEPDIRKKLMYNFEVYNPDTKKTELVNVAHLVKDVDISAEVHNSVIIPFTKKVAQREEAITPNLKSFLTKIQSEIDAQAKNEQQNEAIAEYNKITQGLQQRILVAKNKLKPVTQPQTGLTYLSKEKIINSKLQKKFLKQ